MINRYVGEHWFLSNFYGMRTGDEPIKIILDGITYPTTEHAYMAAKVTDTAIREEIRLLPSPGKAKRFMKERSSIIRPDWEEIKLAVMENLLRQKFSNEKLRAMLLATGDEELVEGNDWDDVFWGVDIATGKGQNHLGRIQMKIRTELKTATPT